MSEIRGGREYREWDQSLEALALIYDAMNFNTKATGNWKKKPPKIDPFPRPWFDKKNHEEQTIKPKSIDELWSIFMARKEAYG